MCNTHIKKLKFFFFFFLSLSSYYIIPSGIISTLLYILYRLVVWRNLSIRDPAMSSQWRQHDQDKMSSVYNNNHEHVYNMTNKHVWTWQTQAFLLSSTTTPKIQYIIQSLQPYEAHKYQAQSLYLSILYSFYFIILHPFNRVNSRIKIYNWLSLHGWCWGLYSRYCMIRLLYI